jgi:hypothetical protein
MIQNHADN